MLQRQDLRGEQILATLAELCESHHAAAVGLPESGAAALPTRLLELSGTHVIIEHPRSDRGLMHASPAQDVRVECGTDAGLLRFETLVRGPWHTEATDQPVLALAAPTSAEIIQRREAYRVSLLETSVTLRPVPVPSLWSAQGHVPNVSSIGAAVTLRGDAPVAVGDVCGVSFEQVKGLPTLSLHGTVIRVERIDPYQRLIGFAWRLDERAGKVVQDQIARFAAARQRPVLRRRRGRT